MIQEIEIHGNNNSILSVNLNDILDCITHGDQFCWSFLWLEAIGSLESMTMLDFEKKINKSSNGYVTNWEELLILSKSFDQIIEVLLIADKDKSKLKRYTNDDEMYSICDLSIELVDSSYWIIHSNQFSLKNMINNLPGAKVIQ